MQASRLAGNPSAGRVELRSPSVSASLRPTVCRMRMSVRGRDGRSSRAEWPARLRVHHFEAETERVRAHRVCKRNVSGAAERVDRRSLDERHAEAGEQRGDPRFVSDDLLEVDGVPEVEDRFPLPTPSGCRTRALDHVDHLGCVVTVRRLWILREPLRRQVVGGHAERPPAVDVHRDEQEHVHELRHLGDAETERDARANERAPEPPVQKLDAHALVTGLAHSRP